MRKSQILKKCLFLTCIAIIIMIVISIMVRYEVEGEKNLPYTISKILVVSTVEGVPTDDGVNIWNVNLKQANDLYFYIEKSEDTDQTIKQITLQNFSLTKEPQKGEVKIYRPTGDLNNLYTYSEQNYLGESLSYTGAKIDDLKTLEIANNGGVIGFRIAIEDLGNFISNETTEITYDASLLNNIEVSLEDINFILNFDILIETNENITYQGNMSIELPANDLFEKGSSNFEITDFSNVVFKRI